MCVRVLSLLLSLLLLLQLLLYCLNSDFYRFSIQSVWSLNLIHRDVHKMDVLGSIQWWESGEHVEEVAAATMEFATMLKPFLIDLNEDGKIEEKYTQSTQNAWRLMAITRPPKFIIQNPA